MGSPAFQALQASQANVTPGRLMQAQRGFAPPGLQRSDDTGRSSKSVSNPQDLLILGQDGNTDATEAIGYYQRVQQMAFQVHFQSSAAQVAASGEDGSSASASAQQMTFDFFGQVRQEELAYFGQKTADISDSLSGTSKQSYLQLSQQVAARFEMSLNVSGAVLSGLTRGADSLGQGGETESLDEFFRLVQDTLASGDESLNQVFDLLDGFFGSGGEDGASFAELISQIYSSGTTGVTSSNSGQAASAQQQSFSFQLNIQMEFSFEAHVNVQQTQVQQSDPIAFDLDGDGIELTNYAQGARFDIQGMGQAVTTAFVTGGDAFLALDRNGNGTIDSGKELFGDQNGAANGYEELAKLDDNRDGVIDRFDKAYSQVVLFKDNGDGKADAGELVSLADAGIESIGLRYSQTDERASGGNRLAQIATFRRTDGTLGRTADAILNFRA